MANTKDINTIQYAENTWIGDSQIWSKVN